MQSYPGSPSSSANPFSLFSLPLSPRDNFEQVGYIADNFKFGTSSASSSASRSHHDSDADSGRSRSNSIVSLISSVASSSKSRSGSIISMFDFSSSRPASPDAWDEDSDDHHSHAPLLCEAKRSSSRYLTIPGLSRSLRKGPKSKQD